MSATPGGEGRRGDPREQLSELGQVMGELVHDLSNEITVLHGWALLARGEVEAGRRPEAEIDRVVEMSATLGHMLRDVLDTVAGRGTSPETVFDPRAETEETVARRVAEMSDLTVRLRIDLPEAVRVAGRVSFWTRALGNLLGNAARYARHEIGVTLGLEVGSTGQRVVLRVEDDGPGIPAPERASIFRPLWRGDRGETGLGLSSVLWSVAQLGGEVSYGEDSVLGGAAFVVRVPAAVPPAVAAREAAEADGMPRLRGMRMLLIDDDASVRHAISRLLDRAGAEVRALDPVDEPAERLLDSILGNLPDVVLLDLRLGERGGVALWRQMCVRHPDLARCVVFASGAAPGEPDWEEALGTGQPVLAKPFDLRDVAAVIGRLRSGR